ncbi:MAG TPA: serine/threonine-protein kinase [Candidatus Eisenbacteria bacterium]|nr:serine/threonine-protein kinase [Candidatus Eisenbacteria bacterium]
MTPEDDDRHERLLKLAQTIADGDPVDWDHALEADPDSSDSIEALRVLESVVAAHVDPPSSIPLPFTWGHLEVREKIGDGAFGEVYRALDTRLRCDVALKLLSSSRAGSKRAADQFIGEARMLAQVRSQHVVTVHGADVHQGRPGLWTDLIRGQTLEQIITIAGQRSDREAATIGVALCQALSAIHKKGLVHRDVKTQNVMREEGSGRIVLMDFGAAAAFLPGELGAREGGESVYGTPLAVAPEVLAGGKATPSSDIYSLGVLLYRLVTRRYPVDASTFRELQEHHRTGTRKPLRDARPDLPGDFVNVVERALEADPAHRYGSVGEMERELLRIGDHNDHGGEARKPPKWRWPLLAAAALAVLFVTYIAWPPTPPHPTPPVVVHTALAANAKLYRERDGTSEQLLPGARVEPGDKLYLELTGDDAMNVYVFNQDEKGSVFVLFPLPGLDAANPLPAKQSNRLPGSRQGVPESWQVTSAGGSEELFVVASRTPLAALEHELAAVPRARPGAPVELGQEVLHTLRGIGGTEPSQVETAKAPRLSEVLAKVSEDPARSKDLWVWQTRLANPESQGD